MARTAFSRFAAFCRLVSLLILALTVTGCISHRYRHENTAAVIDEPHDGEDEAPWRNVIENCYLYPVRDAVAGHWFIQARDRNRAWNLDADGNVPDGSFYTNRDLSTMSPEQFDDPWGNSKPQMPLKVAKKKKGGASAGFIGKDARGRTYMVKFDDPDYPELSTAAEAIGSRVAWAMGYHVPPAHIITVEGTGEPKYDARRGVAVQFCLGKVLGAWKFEHVKFRREVRAFRVVATWINEIDHGDNNTLQTWDGRQNTYWFIDFNSSLGCWQGRPKEPQMGWVQYWDPHWQLAMFFTLGLVRPQYDPKQPVVSPAIGRFDERLDARQWRSRQENPAYNQLTDDDARWMVGKMMELSQAQLAAIVQAGRYSHPADEQYILRTLLARRDRIAATFTPAVQPAPPEQAAGRR